MTKRESLKLVSIKPTRVWIENGSFGSRSVMVQHEGCPVFEYARFNYDYRYTSNASTFDAAESLARSLGAQDPIEHFPGDMFVTARPDQAEKLTRTALALAEAFNAMVWCRSLAQFEKCAPLDKAIAKAVAALTNAEVAA